jgi:signal transduction histidine kinase
LDNLSHELRTPLNSIIGFSQLLQKQSFGPLGDARYLGYANDINLGGQHLLDLINDILALSKIESGSVVADEYAETNIDDVISDVLHLLMPLADQRGVSLEVSGPMAGTAIVVSERMLRQILLNVLSNALKFTDRDGLVRIMVETRREGDLVVLVHDTGVGMNEEEISIALTPFGQVPNRADARGNPQGTGLGLPLVKAMMELQQGTVQIDSVPGDGTIVSLVFPASRVRLLPLLRRANSH